MGVLWRMLNGLAGSGFSSDVSVQIETGVD